MKLKYLLISVLFINCSNTPDRLTIAAASNMQFVMDQLTNRFTELTEIETEVIFGSSGKLTAQIQQGAPFDLFLSADIKYPKALYESAKAEDEPTVYANGKLVLWTVDENADISMQKLTEVDHIAIPNPEIAPYGRAAKQVIAFLDLHIEDKLVYGESVAQANQFVISGAAAVGFTAQSVVISELENRRLKWIEVDPRTYQPIQQAGAVLTNRSIYRTEAYAFLVFLISEEGQKILMASGYDIPNSN